MWKVDLTQKGFDILFKPYQRFVISVLQSDQGKAFGSGILWEMCESEEIKISRASVIFFLEKCIEDGLVTYEDTTGKGGKYKLYKIEKSGPEVEDHIMTKIMLGLLEVFPENPDILLYLTDKGVLH